jgi:hypothetical protein
VACNEKYIIELAIASFITNIVFGTNYNFVKPKMAQLS